MSENKTVQAGCLCGAVRFELQLPSKWCAHCHCSMCRRAEAWNPMNPLFEPVMMFRSCGGGRPSFEMPSRPGHVLLR